jgi:hypothetical protein
VPPLPLHLSAVQYVGTLFNLAKAEQQLGRQEASQALMGQVLELADGVAGAVKGSHAEGVAPVPACLPHNSPAFVARGASMWQHASPPNQQPPKPAQAWPAVAW